MLLLGLLVLVLVLVHRYAPPPVRTVILRHDVIERLPLDAPSIVRTHVAAVQVHQAATVILAIRIGLGRVVIAVHGGQAPGGSVNAIGSCEHLGLIIDGLL